MRGAVASLTAVWFTGHASVHDDVVGSRPFGADDLDATIRVGKVAIQRSGWSAAVFERATRMGSTG